MFLLWTVHGRIAQGAPDFTAFYTAGRMVRTGQGHQLYDPAAQYKVQREFTPNSDLRQGPLRYIHPAFEALVFVPLSFLSYVKAFVAWSLLNLVILFIVCLLLRHSLALYRIQNWEIALAVLAFFPIYANFYQGQDAILLLLLVALAFQAMKSGSEFAAGCWLGAGLFRYQLILPLVLILILWGHRKLIYGFLTAAVLAVLSSAAVAGFPAVLQYPAYLWHWASTPGMGRTPISFFPNLLGLVAGWSTGQQIPWLLTLVVSLASIALLFVAARMRPLAKNPESSDLAMGCAVLVSVLVGYNTSTYDLSLLVVPLALVIRYCFQEPLAHPRRAMIALMAPAIPLLVSPVWFVVGMRWKKFNLMAIFLLWWLFAIRRELLRVGKTETTSRKVSPAL